MLIRNINIENKYINYKNLHLDFSKCGIYYFIGENGTGKTTIMKEIVFHDYHNNIEFNNEEYLFYYDKMRYNLFAYMPQEIIESDLVVEKYLIKDNSNVDINYAIDLMKLLDLDYNLLKQKFFRLSGGEKIKFSIISTLIRKTPYIFLDEPTNYLDDASIILLKKVLQDISTNSTIIISTHDERLLDMSGTKIYLNGNKALVSSDDDNHSIENNTSISAIKKINIPKVIFRNHNRFLNYLILGLMIIVIAFFSGYYQYSYYQNYSKDEIPAAGYLQIYSADEEYSELNRKYIENEDITIDSKNLYNMINTNDIYSISKISGIRDIYIKDFPKYTEASAILFQSDHSFDYKDIDFVKTFVFSFPNIVYENSVFLNMMGLSDFLFLNSGRIPLEGKNEVSISENLLVQYFGYTKENSKSAMGKLLEIDGKKYKIVGIQTLDICLVSYADDAQYGIYKFNNKTYDQYQEYLNTYMETNQYINKNIDSLLIVTEIGKEKSVLNYLIAKFPANNYYSSAFVKSWKVKNNSEFEKNFTLIFSFIAIIIGIIFMLIQISQISNNIKRMRDYECYYLTNRIIEKYYLNFIMIEMFIVYFLGIISSLLFNKIFAMFWETFYLAAITNLFVTIPSTIYAVIKIVKTRKK